MKLISKVLVFTFIMSMMLLLVSSSLVLAVPGDTNTNPGAGGTSTGTGSITGIDPKDLAAKESALDTDATGKLGKVSGSIIRYLSVIGMMAAVIVLAVYGIQWIVASPQQKAVLKEKAMAYVIGAILVFGGMTIMGIIASGINGAFGGGTTTT